MRAARLALGETPSPSGGCWGGASLPYVPPPPQLPLPLAGEGWGEGCSPRHRWNSLPLWGRAGVGAAFGVRCPTAVDQRLALAPFAFARSATSEPGLPPAVQSLSLLRQRKEPKKGDPDETPRPLAGVRCGERSRREISQTRCAQTGKFLIRLNRSPQPFQTGVEQSRAEQSRAEQSRAEQSRAEQSRAEQSRAEQSRAEQSRAEQSRAEQSRRSSVQQRSCELCPSWLPPHAARWAHPCKEKQEAPIHSGRILTPRRPPP